jgi:uroporphyrin-III C-methyltransferase
MGKVYLIGAGPGAPDLLTLRAANLLATADIVFYDALVHPDTVALAVNAKKIAVGKRAGLLSTEQRFINRTLVEAGLRYESIVRLKGGDPMIFGRAQEEIDALKEANIPVEVVPGITSALAAAASLQISLTKRGVSRSVSFATPRVGRDEIAGEWMRASANSDTTILYMALGEAESVQNALISEGMSAATPFIIIENVSLDNERKISGNIGQLAQVASVEINGPAILCIGEVFATQNDFIDDGFDQSHQKLRLN